MKDENKTKEKLINELVELRQRIAELKNREIQYKQVEEAPKTEHEFVSVVLSTIGALVVVLDLRGRIILFNKACEQTTGYLFDEVKGRHVWDLFLIPEEVEPVKAVFKNLRAGQFPNEYENDWITRDGSWRRIAWSNTVLLDSEGSVEHIIGTGIDVTETKRAKERIEHLNAVLRALRNVNQLITKEKDRDRLLKGACDNLVGTRGYHNAWIALINESEELVQTAEAGLGDEFLPLVEWLKRGKLPDCGRRVLMESGVLAIKDPRSVCHDCPLAENYGGREAMSIRLEYDGTVFGVLTVSIPSDLAEDQEEQSLFNEVADDIAFALHNLELENRRKQAEARLLEAEKLAVVGKLAAGVAHSIRNPLTSVKMRLFSLERNLDLSATQKDDFEVISEEIRHIDKIVRNFLEFSRPAKLMMQKVSPSDVVDMALHLLRDRLKSYGAKVQVSRQRRLPEIWVDPAQLKEVLVNLLVNAFEAMGVGGSIVIQEQEGIEDPLGRVVVVRLIDNGPGIPQSVRDKVFQPFFSTKEEGTGLGLSIAARIVNEHGGRLDLKSQEGEGAIFKITLPLKEEESWERS